MKKILVFMMVLLLALPIILAADFDNVVYWSADNRTATIVDNFGFGSVIANVTLISGFHNYVEVGDDRIVLQFYVENFGSVYSDGFKKFRFDNLGTGIENEDWKSFTWQQAKFETVDVYGEVCEETYDALNDSISKFCSTQVIGTEEIIKDWQIFPTTDIPTGTWTVGIQTDVEEGDIYDGIPTFFGVEMDRWAVWEAVVKDAHGVTLDNTAPDTGEWGGKIYTNYALRLVAFNISDTSAATNCYVLDRFNNTYATGSLTGDNCSFSPNAELRNDTFYYLVTNATGSWNHDQVNSFAGPKAGTAMNFIQGRLKGVEFSGWAEVEAVWTQKKIPELGTTVELLNPNNNLNTGNTSITFIANVTTDEFAGGSLDNATLYFWYGNDTLHGTNYTALSGNTTATMTLTLSNLSRSANSQWNVYGCSSNATAVNCSFAGANNTINLVGFTEVDTTYNATSYETSSEEFQLNVTYESSSYSAISGTLYYNNTAYATNTSGSGDSKLFSSLIDVPYTDKIRNVSFHWVIGLTDVSGTSFFNSTISNQSIDTTIFDVCNSTLTTQTVNYTVYDEANNDTLNLTDFDATFKYSLGGSNLKNYSVELRNQSSYNFCIDPNLTTYFTDVQIAIAQENYTTRLYNMPFEVFTNVSTYRALYLLNESDTKTVIVELKDTGLSPLEDYNIKIYRFLESSGEYILVEDVTTDAFGQVVTSLVENNVKYRFEFYDKTGTLQKTVGNVIIACRTTICVIPFIIEDTVDDFERFQNISNFDYTLIFDNSSNTYTLSWNDNTGDAITVRLLVTRYLLNGTSTVCNTTSLLSQSSISCSVGDEAASYNAQGFRTVDGSQTRFVIISNKVGDQSGTFGLEGLMWSLVLLLTLILVGIFSPVVGITLYLFGFILLGLLGIIYVNPMIIIAEIIIGVLFIWAFRS